MRGCLLLPLQAGRRRQMPHTEKVDAALDRIVVRLVRESEPEAALA